MYTCVQLDVCIYIVKCSVHIGSKALQQNMTDFNIDRQKSQHLQCFILDKSRNIGFDVAGTVHVTTKRRSYDLTN